MNEPLNETLIERRNAPAFYVSVVLEQRHRTYGSGLKVPVWTLLEVLVRNEIDQRSDNSGSTPKSVIEKTVVQNAEESLRVVWTGFRLEFYRDGGESYWHTLVGEQQELFVVCQDDEEGQFTPILVTADYDEAMAYQEADDTVLSAPMPEKIYLVLERFVLENYAPQQKKRRKRKKWHGEEESDEAFARKPKA